MLQCFSGLIIAGKAFCSQKFPSSSSSDCAQMTCRLVERYVPTRKNNHQRNKTIGGKQAAYKMPRARRAQKRKNYLDTCLIMTTGRDGRREKKRERVKTQEGNGPEYT